MMNHYNEIKNNFGFQMKKNSYINNIFSEVQPSSSLELFQTFITLFTIQSREKRRNSLRAAIDNLYSYDDPLILLILENTLIDILHSKLKIQISTQSNEIHSGSFSHVTRCITINDNSWMQEHSVSNDAALLLHEMTHAVNCFAFRTDPAAMKKFFEYSDIAGSEAVEMTVNKAWQEFAICPQTPYKAESSRHIFFKFARGDHRRFENGLNPAEMKFKQCMREDGIKLKETGYVQFLEEKELNEAAFKYQQAIYDKQYPSEPEEIFSRYMECRYQLLMLASKNQISKEEAFTTLRNISPRLHDYFETDVKKVLQFRIMHYQRKFPHEFVSYYLKKFPPKEESALNQRFAPDGTIRFMLKR